MPKTGFTIKNLDKFNKAMLKSPKLAEKHLGKGLLEALFIVQGQARQLSPIDTGRLRSSIGVGAGKARVQKNTGYVGTNVEYSVYVHEGTSRMRGRPFLKNALTKTQAKIKKVLEGSIEDLWREVKLKSHG
jgi:HK97 gp10 family phage protein